MATSDRKARLFEQRSQDILAAALALFRTQQWQSVTVDQIAREAEVSKGTIYAHFASKDEVYARLAINFDRQTLAKVQALDPAQPPDERLRQLIHFVWETQLGSRELHRVYVYCSRDDFHDTLPADTAAEMKAISDEITAVARGLMADGIARGLFADKPVDTLMFGVTSAVWGAIQVVWSGHLGDIDRDRHLDDLLDFTFAALAPRQHA